MFGKKKTVSSDIGLYVGAHTTIEGKMFSTNGAINISGSFKGDIVTQDLVIVTEEGKVEGTIKSKELQVYGKVNGNIEIEEELIIGSRGVIEGEVSYGSLHVEEGGQIRGNLAPKTKGQEPDKRKSKKQVNNKGGQKK